ncbi:MAG TPA: amidohydrolase family protein [Methanomassiliicoccales archaeon]|nr:amidohydrolase family protein [Methanomassiliicoccales archaeon]
MASTLVMSSLLVKNALILTQNAKREVLRGDLLAEDGRIVSIGKVKGTADEVIDADGDLLIPGFVNAHTHVAMAIMKGVADDVPFDAFLNRVFALDARRIESDIVAGARLGCLEMIKGGTTTFVDMYYSEDAVAQAVEESGIRGILCWAVLDKQYTTQKGVPLDNCKRFFRKFKGKERVIPGIGLQGVYVCSEETFLASKEFAEKEDLLLHFHLSETRGEVYEHKRKHGARPCDWLAKIGFLNGRCLAAHSAWLTINEMRALAKAGASIATCPVSNMKLATGGVAPIPEFLKEGVNVALGTDGSTTNNSLDMFGEMKTLALLQKSNRWDPTVVSAQAALDFATIGGAKAIGLEDELGSLEVGKRADLVLIDTRAANVAPMTAESAVSSLVYSTNAGNVRGVVCAGRILMRDRRVLTLNEREVVETASVAAQDLRARAG